MHERRRMSSSSSSSTQQQSTRQDKVERRRGDRRGGGRQEVRGDRGGGKEWRNEKLRSRHTGTHTHTQTVGTEYLHYKVLTKPGTDRQSDTHSNGKDVRMQECTECLQGSQGWAGLGKDRGGQLGWVPNQVGGLLAVPQRQRAADGLEELTGCCESVTGGATGVQNLGPVLKRALALLALWLFGPAKPRVCICVHYQDCRLVGGGLLADRQWVDEHDPVKPGAQPTARTAGFSYILYHQKPQLL